MKHALLSLSPLLVLGPLAAQNAMVTASAAVQTLSVTTQRAGMAANTQLLPPGTPIGLGAMVGSTTGVPFARSQVGLETGPARIELALTQLALAGTGDTAAFDAAIAVTFTASAFVTGRLQIETKTHIPSPNGTTGVDLNQDGTVDLFAVPGSTSQTNLSINGSRTIVLLSSGSTDPSAATFQVLSRNLVVRLVAIAPLGRINPVLAPCTELRLDAAPTFTGGVALTPETALLPPQGLTLIVLGFQPIFATVPPRPGCFWTPSSDITIGQPAGATLVLDQPGLAGVQMFVQSASFDASSAAFPAVYISDSYRLQF